MMMMIMFQVPEEESKPANQHRSSVDMTSHPQVIMMQIILLIAMTILMVPKIILYDDDLDGDDLLCLKHRSSVNMTSHPLVISFDDFGDCHA